MAWLDGIAKGLGAIVSPITNVFVKKQERKTKKVEADGKIALAKQNGDNEVSMSVSHWEATSKSNESDTWKDEYATIIGTMPYLLIFAGAIWYAFTGDDTLLKGVNLGIDTLKDAGVDVGHIMEVVIYAAVSIKAYKSL